jgi:cytochrome c5
MFNIQFALYLETTMKKYYILMIVLVLASVILAQCAPAAPTNLGNNSAPATSGSGQTLDGKQLFETRCSACHSTDRVTQLKKTPDQWATTVTRMIGHGAQLSDAEKKAVIDYLSNTYK